MTVKPIAPPHPRSLLARALAAGDYDAAALAILYATALRLANGGPTTNHQEQPRATRQAQARRPARQHQRA